MHANGISKPVYLPAMRTKAISKMAVAFWRKVEFACLRHHPAIGRSPYHLIYSPLANRPGRSQFHHQEVMEQNQVVGSWALREGSPG